MYSYARAFSYVVVAFAFISTPLLPIPSAEAAESASASFRNTRSDVNTGGRRKTSGTYREDGTIGSVSQTTATSSGYRHRDGLQTSQHYPNRVTDLWGSSAAVSTQIYLQWTSPGNDGSESGSTPGAYIVRYSSIAADSPAISDAKFNAATAVTPAPPAAQVRGSLVTMTVTGLMGGVTYYFAIKTAERDGTRSALSAGATAQTLAPYGCFITRNVHKVDGTYTTIQSAVDSLPTVLPGHSCVIIRDVATYGEQVTVRNFINNGASITIAAYPPLSQRPVVAPPGASQAGFVLANSSVNLIGLDIIPAGNVTYGVVASSANVRISSVNVDGGTRVQTAGVHLSSWSVVERSSFTVNAAGASGILIAGNFNAVRFSSAQAGATGAAAAALFIAGADSNSVTNSYVTSTGGGGLLIRSGADHNSVALTTMTSASDFAFQASQASATTVVDSYMQGASAAVVEFSTGVSFGNSVFIATNTTGSALILRNGSANLAIATSSLVSPAQGRGLSLDSGGTGIVSVGSVTFSGSARGIEISTQGGGFILAVDSVTFRNLASGATAIHFLGGTFISTITLANFEDTTTGANVSGAALDLASRVTMRAYRGPRVGGDYENDPNSLVDWADSSAPANVAVWFVGMSSAALTYAAVGAEGYVVQASTRADFGGGVTVSSTVFGAQDRLTVSPLMPNTTYFLRAGSLWNGASVYAQTVIATATLSQLVTGTTVYNIHLTSMVVNWLPLPLAPPAASSMSAQGYVLQASSMASFSPLWSSSVTPNVALSTLTIDTLRGGVTYYFRVGSLNHNSVPHFAGAVSTLMPVQLGVELTTHTISVPGLVNMGTSVLITTSVIVTNTGNVKETYWVRATTLTVGSPWRIGATAGVNQYVLSMLINSTPPLAGDFGVGEDELDDPEKACTTAVFAFGGNCVQLPIGATRTLWFKLDTPLVTSTIAAQDIRIYVRAARDPDPDPNP